MEAAGEAILIRPEVRKIVPIVSDWDFINGIYQFSLRHKYAEGYRGFIPNDPDTQEGWWATRSKVEVNDDNIATRRLELAHTELPLTIGFVAIGIPLPWESLREDDKVVRWDSRRNTVWVQPLDIERRLKPILDYESFAIRVQPENPDPVRFEDPKPINLVEVERTSKQKISPTAGLREIDRTARLLKRSSGYVPRKQPVKRNHRKSVQSSLRSSQAR